MKKWLIILGMITCMMGLTACGSKDLDEADIMPNADAEKLASDYISMVSGVVDSQAEETYLFLAEYSGENAAVYDSAFESWKSAVEEMGGVKEIAGITENTMQVMYIQGQAVPVEGTLIVKLIGGTHDAQMEIMYEKGALTSISTNVDYSFGENMKKAGLNTLLGMGTVFCVLILISFIISAFGLISKVQNKLDQKNKAAEVKAKAVDNTIAQIAEKEELSDDLELVAVIAAAIAASEGASSTDGFVVRSIRRAGNKWQAAGRAGM